MKGALSFYGVLFALSHSYLKVPALQMGKTAINWERNSPENKGGKFKRGNYD